MTPTPAWWRSAPEGRGSALGGELEVCVRRGGTVGAHCLTCDLQVRASGRLKAVRLPGSGSRRFRREDIERMRSEMWSQFEPETLKRQLAMHVSGSGFDHDGFSDG